MQVTHIDVCTIPGWTFWETDSRIYLPLRIRKQSEGVSISHSCKYDTGAKPCCTAVGRSAQLWVRDLKKHLPGTLAMASARLPADGALRNLPRYCITCGAQ